MQILVYEDPAVQTLSPITTGRPAYGITCATFRLVDWLRLTGLPMLGCVRDHLVEIQKLDYGIPPWSSGNYQETPTFVINSRLVPQRHIFDWISQFEASDQALRMTHQGETVAAYFPSMPNAPADADSFSLWFRDQVAPLRATEAPLPLFRWPHDVVAENMRLMNENLEFRIAQGGYTQTADGVFLGPGARLGQFPVIDTSHGPILLDADVQVGPFCYLSGPVYAGPRTRVIEHAALKDGVSLGHTVKIGGEVEASVIEPFSNKQHHGFLGHSYLGSWINLGAGTCNSDLKNTYGLINMQYGNERVQTSMQFMGCVMGDYTKTAINTGIFTGKVIGVCSMLYGFVTSNVPSFVNYARLFGQTAELPPDVMIATQQRMFSRRKVTQRPCDQQLIRDMHRLTELEREGQLGML